MTPSTKVQTAGLAALILPAPDALAVWGRSPAARTRRELAMLQVPATEGTDLPAANSPLLLLRGDVIFHHSVLRGLIDHADTALVDAAGRPLAAHVRGYNRADEVQAAFAWLREEGDRPAELRPVRAADVAHFYNVQLRRRNDPYALRVTRETRPKIEKRIFMATYKGVTDLVTKYWWPVPARIITRWCVQLGLTPNMVTAIGAVLVLAVCWLFANGHFGSGLALGWVMALLDTVDGKLARVTLTSSKLGEYFDHGIDLLHPLAWYYAWGLGLMATGQSLSIVIVMELIFGGYIAGRLCEGLFIKQHGFHIHVWRRFDSAFRLVLARRNPNMIILTLAVLAGRPDTGLWLVAGWTVMTLLVHLVQIAQAAIASRHAPLHSWLETPAGPST